MSARKTLFILAFLTALAPQKAEAATFSVVADGLDNARGLSFAPDGSLYVTEAGSGGTGACVPSPTGGRFMLRN